MSQEQSFDAGESGQALLRAAEYVRMSTEHQRYSTDNQGRAIRAYAARRGLEVVRTYADQGKSGLDIGGREGLRRLLDDVTSGDPGFSVVLVYDVSRWGRFQDADESAYYEYQCRKAGVAVEYCAEPFDNDGSLGSDIQKVLKRKMAGEYSRELSVKVFAGQCRLIELGYRQGGPAGYGLRRQLLDDRGEPKALLRHLEHKSIHTDRVVLVPGPSEEVEVVRHMYHAFVDEARSEGEIAAALNARGVLTDLGRPWTRGTVHQVLVNEKYAGDNVWNRTSSKLRRPRVRNGPELLVRREAAFEPVVERSLFEAAQALVRSRSTRLSDADMLRALRRLFERHGHVSALLIDETEECPSSSAYRSRFGSLLRTYALVGYAPNRDYAFVEANRRLRERHPVVVAETVERILAAGGRVAAGPREGAFLVNEEVSIEILLSRCRETRPGTRRWSVAFDGTDADVTLVVRMQPGERTALDYYLFPGRDVTSLRLSLGHRNEVGLDAYRFDDLDSLVDLVRRVPLREVA